MYLAHRLYPTITWVETLAPLGCKMVFLVKKWRGLLERDLYTMYGGGVGGYRGICGGLGCSVCGIGGRSSLRLCSLFGRRLVGRLGCRGVVGGLLLLLGVLEVAFRRLRWLARGCICRYRLVKCYRRVSCRKGPSYGSLGRLFARLFGLVSFGRLLCCVSLVETLVLALQELGFLPWCGG